MAGSDESSTPDSIPLADTEIDRLLREAEALTTAVAAEIGAAAQAGAARSGLPDASSGDAEAAAEAVERDIGQLDRQLGDADPASEAPGTNEHPGDSPATAGAADGPRVEHAPATGDGVHAAGAGPDGPGRLLSPLSKETTADPGERSAKSKETAGTPATDKSADGATQGGSADPPVPRPKRTIRSLAISAIRGVPRGIRTIVRAPSSTSQDLLLLLDRPFKNISAVNKGRIGIIALITIVLGAISILLPLLLGGNPYEHIGPYPE